LIDVLRVAHLSTWSQVIVEDLDEMHISKACR